MIIIISSAKAMNINRDSIPCRDTPEFIDKAQEICSKLKSMDYDSLKALWKCNDEIAKLNVQRLARMNLSEELTSAILAYDGIQYQYMAPGELTKSELEYLQSRLRILSGFYGLLRPLDGIRPYRLEMQAKLPIGGEKDLYGYWGDMLAQSIFDKTDCIINLASKEYSKCVSKYLTADKRLITCLFGEKKDGKLIEKGTMCKIARGEMVRWMAQNRVQDPEQLKNFEGTYHRYSPEYSDENNFAFLKK